MFSQLHILSGQEEEEAVEEEEEGGGGRDRKNRRRFEKTLKKRCARMFKNAIIIFWFREKHVQRAKTEESGVNQE